MSSGREFRSRLGYLLDLYNVGRLRFRVPHSYTKFLLIDRLRRRYASQTFIETGTYLGITTARAAKTFPRVITIELDTVLAQRATHRFGVHRNVRVVQGDAVSVLPDILAADDIRNAVVYLDAHYSGGETASSGQPEPALEELSILARFKQKVAAIVIDDFILFGTESGTPRKSELFRQLEQCFPTPAWEIDVLLNMVRVMRAGPSN